ncbi:MAG TPA: TIGR01210 family radical SAM protein [Thermoplasmatales archaeon]|nr:TIGR01210 family radical SAM protein [Thermoplasmatales archaeon]
MNDINRFVQQIKKNVRRHVQDPKKPVGCWSEDDLIDGKKTRSLVMILKTSGCRWSRYSGCTMCGYFNDSLEKSAEPDELIAQTKHALSLYNGEEGIKIFTSGSFLDDNEIPNKLQINILKRCAEQNKVKKISVESRPEFINKEKIREIRDSIKPVMLEVSIGLESANDTVLQNAINKGFKFKDYKEAVSVLKKENILVKTYVLIKPPFLTEHEAIQDSVNTVKKIKDMTDTISFNPVSVHRNTLVEYLWKRGEYRPPWLWSIIEILRRSKEMASGLEIKCDVTGGGTRRGAHNCKTCNSEILEAIRKFSLKQDTNVFNGLECSCKQTWEGYLDLEPFTYGPLVVKYEKGW